jgi:hypothetical protein
MAMGGFRCQKCERIIKGYEFRFKYKKVGEDSIGRPKYNWICTQCKLQEEKNE